MKKLRKFWEDHHEAIITGAVTFVTTAATGAVYMTYNNRQNSIKKFAYLSPESEDSDALLEMTFVNGKVQYLPMPTENMNITPSKPLPLATPNPVLEVAINPGPDAA